VFFGVFYVETPDSFMENLCVFKRFVTSPENKNTTEFGGLVNASGPRSTSLQFYIPKTLILPLNRGKEMCRSG